MVVELRWQGCVCLGLGLGLLHLLLRTQHKGRRWTGRATAIQSKAAACRAQHSLFCRKSAVSGDADSGRQAVAAPVLRLKPAAEEQLQQFRRTYKQQGTVLWRKWQH